MGESFKHCTSRFWPELLGLPGGGAWQTTSCTPCCRIMVDRIGKASAYGSVPKPGKAWPSTAEVVSMQGGNIVLIKSAVVSHCHLGLIV